MFVAVCRAQLLDTAQNVFSACQRNNAIRPTKMLDLEKEELGA